MKNRTLLFFSTLFTTQILLPVGPTTQPPIITAVLGTGLGLEYFQPSDKELNQAADDLKKYGFTTSWDASPQVFTHRRGGLLSNAAYFQHYRKLSAILHSRGIGVAIGFQRPQLLPGTPLQVPHLYGEKINIETGGFEKENWNIGSPDALAAYSNALATFFDKLGVFEMLYADEVILGEPGPFASKKKMSGYWTSPTYSKEALVSFRTFLSQKKFPRAMQRGFPVTTIALPPDDNHNMGLPAIPINEKNSDRIEADNQWPTSDLWKHWYTWRSKINTQWIEILTILAHRKLAPHPGWRGFYYEAPSFWMVPELGQDLEAIANLPHVDFLVAGYTTGHQYQGVKKVADRFHKKWGVQVEVSRYGQSNGMPVTYITNTFRQAVGDGASIITCYAGQSFRSDRISVSPKDASNGWYFMKDQAGAWLDCVKWAGEKRGIMSIPVADFGGSR